MFASLDTDGYLDSRCTLIELAGSDTHAESLSWDDFSHFGKIDYYDSTTVVVD
jgi:hypothetical protein